MSIVIIFIIVLTVLLCFIGVLAYVFYLRKINREQKLAEENELLAQQAKYDYSQSIKDADKEFEEIKKQIDDDTTSNLYSQAQKDADEQAKKDTEDICKYLLSKKCQDEKLSKEEGKLDALRKYDKDVIQYKLRKHLRVELQDECEKYESVEDCN